MLTKYKRYKAFTLAEVLIVLVIIGVIASITIPSLILTQEKISYVTALKKFYSTASQALMQTATDNGTPDNIAKSNNDYSSKVELMTDIARHFKIAKDCKTNNYKGCWTDITKRNYDGTGDTYRYDANYEYIHYYEFMTTDGMSVAISMEYPDCSRQLYSDRNNPLYKFCGEMVVDVNGLKGPNRFGRDTFMFQITSNKSPLLVPLGVYNSNEYWKSTNPCTENYKIGTGCAGRIMEENWQMTY